MSSSTLVDKKRDTLCFLISHFKPVVFYVRESQLAKHFWRLQHKKTMVLRFLPFDLKPEQHELLGAHTFGDPLGVRKTHLVLDLRCVPANPRAKESEMGPDSYSCVDTGLQLFKNLIKADCALDASDHTSLGIFFPVVPSVLGQGQEEDPDRIIRVQPFGLVSYDVMIFIRDLFEDVGISTYYTEDECRKHRGLPERQMTYCAEPFPTEDITRWARQQVNRKDLLEKDDLFATCDYFSYNPTLKGHLAQACEAIHGLSTLTAAIQDFESFTFGNMGLKGTGRLNFLDPRWSSFDGLNWANPRLNVALPLMWWCNATRYAFRGEIREAMAAEGGFAFYSFRRAYAAAYDLAKHAFEQDGVTRHPYDNRMDLRGERVLYKYAALPSWLVFMIAEAARAFGVQDVRLHKEDTFKWRSTLPREGGPPKHL